MVILEITIPWPRFEREHVITAGLLFSNTQPGFGSAMIILLGTNFDILLAMELMT